MKLESILHQAMLEYTNSHLHGVDDAELWERHTGTEGSEITLSSTQWDTQSSESENGFVFFPNTIAPPDFLRSDSILRNIWQFGNETVEFDTNAVPWLNHLPSRHFRDRLHRFNWLADLFAIGAAGSDRARYLVDSWINVFGHFDSFAWRFEPTADRLWNWLKCGDLLFSGNQSEQEKSRLMAFKRQVSYLEATVEKTRSPLARWRAVCVFVAYRMCLQTTEDLHWALERLQKECLSQFSSDGCHASRSPSASFEALLDVALLVDLFHQTSTGVPRFLIELQSKLFSAINFFRQGDDGIAPFNGGKEIRPELFDVIRRFVDSWPKQKTTLRQAGFYRMERGEALLILDAGRTPEPEFGTLAHAGAFGIELSDGASRLVTSCGHSLEVNPVLQQEVRKTNSHSTMSLEGADSVVFTQCPRSKLFSPEIVPDVHTRYIEDNGCVWINAQHAGYHRLCYLTHNRRLYMNSDGTQIIGEDSVERPISGGVKDNREHIDYAIRFHIHPSTAISQRGDGIWLEPNIGSRWAFKTSNANVRIEPSIYVARDNVEETEQIVVYGKADPAGLGSKPPNCVRWTFKKQVE